MKNKNNVTVYSTEFSGSIDCHGMTVEEMLEAVDKSLDKCLLKDREKLEIIHGIGSGILRKHLSKHLDLLLEKNNIKRWEYGGTLNDDPAITVVFL